MELLSIPGGVEGAHYMSINILSYLVTSIAKQDWPVSDPYQDPRCMSASRWKAGLDKCKMEAVNHIEKHLDHRLFFNNQVLPGCLRGSGYLDFAFKMEPPNSLLPVPWPPVLRSAQIRTNTP